LQQLCGDGPEEILLNFHPAEVARPKPKVVLAETHQLYRLRSRELLISLGQKDVERRNVIGIVVNHGHGDIEPHPAQSVHQLGKCLQVQGDVEVRPEANHPPHLIPQSLYRSRQGEDGVDLLAPVHVNQGIPRETHHIDRLGFTVHQDQHERICEADLADIVLAGDHDRENLAPL